MVACSREVVHPPGSGGDDGRGASVTETPTRAARGRRPGATLPGCTGSARAGFAVIGSTPTPVWVTGSRCARRRSARRHVGGRRRRRGGRATRITSWGVRWRSGRRRCCRRRRPRRRRSGCGRRLTDFPGTSRKTSSGSKVRISLGSSAECSWRLRKTRGGSKSRILHEKRADIRGGAGKTRSRV